MGVEEVHRLDAFALHVGVEVQSAGGEPAALENAQHRRRRVVQVGGELIGIPAQQQVAAVGVDRAEHVVGHREFQLVLEAVLSECGVVGLDVELEVLGEAVLAEEAQDGCRVEIVLVLGGLFGLGLDVEGPVEADCLLVLDGQV